MWIPSTPASINARARRFRPAVLTAALVVLLLPGVSRSAGFAGLSDDYLIPFDDDDPDIQGEIISPQICPADSNWISFEVESRFEIKLFVYNADTKERLEIESARPSSSPFGGGVSTVAQNRDLAWRPSIAADGKIWLAFVGNGTGNMQLYLMNLTDREAIELPSPRDEMGSALEREPAWSPDGKVLTYRSNVNENLDIFVIRDMDDVLKSPRDTLVVIHDELVNGSGEEFGGVWCPAPKSGWLAYNYLDRSKQKTSEIRIYDPRTTRHYRFIGRDTTLNYFAPSWHPSGKRIAYLQYRQDQEPLGADELIPEGQEYYLGIVDVSGAVDSLALRPVMGGVTGAETGLAEIAKNPRDSRGPAWLPDGRNLLVPFRDETIKNPMRVINPLRWKRGLHRSSWMEDFAPRYPFDFSLDIQIVRRNLVFTYARGQSRWLVMGALQPRDSYNEPLTYLYSAPDRQVWWDAWVEREKPRAGGWIMRPILGMPDLLFNRHGLLIVEGVAVAAFVLAGGETTPPTPRNWTPPDFPGSASKRPGIFTIGF